MNSGNAVETSNLVLSLPGKTPGAAFPSHVGLPRAMQQCSPARPNSQSCALGAAGSNWYTSGKPLQKPSAKVSAGFGVKRQDPSASPCSTHLSGLQDYPPRATVCGRGWETHKTRKKMNRLSGSNFVPEAVARVRAVFMDFPEPFFSQVFIYSPVPSSESSCFPDYNSWGRYAA